MMARHAAGGHKGIYPGAFDCTGSCVVNLRSTVKALLERLGRFSNVVGLSNQVAEIRGSKVGSKCSAPLCGTVQVVFYCLFSVTFCKMCPKYRAIHSTSPFHQNL